MNEPQIPKETYEAMKEFFLKNSAPRILAEKKKEAKEEKQTG